MTESNDFDTKNKDEMICPYCGYPQDLAVAWEITIRQERGDACCGRIQGAADEFVDSKECGETECQSCGKEFEWSVFIDVRYSTKR